MMDYEIYLIEHEHYWYVGSASGRSTAAHRWHRHVIGRGGAQHLRDKIQELGVETFTMAVVERGEGDPIEAEQRWYDWYLAYDPRCTLNGKRPCSYPNNTPEAKEKISRALRGRRKSPQVRANMSQAQQGHPVTAATRAKLSEALTGKTLSETHRAKVLVPLQVHTQCGGCTMVTTPGPLARHREATGHPRRVYA